jgi:acyl-CoA thioesterase-1
MTHTRSTLFLSAAALAVLTLAAPMASAAEPMPAGCRAPSDVTRLDYVLARTSRRIADREPLKIVAIGSSSTAGAGASSPAASYPSRLEAYLRERFPKETITVTNRGVNGEEAREMLARFDESVIAEKPDLVLWQVGSNAVLRDHPIAPANALIREGVRRLKDAGADVVLVNPQFAPKIIGKPDLDSMIKLIDIAAKEAHVGVFHRFSVMRHWYETEHMPFEAFLSPDELHMNDWSYACVAKLLAGAIVEAATRPTASARIAR